MIFRTELNIPESAVKISHSDQIFMIGSCFTDNIGDRLQKYKFNCTSNPFGNIFNPISISRLISHSIQKIEINRDQLLHVENKYVHHDFHSKISDKDPDETLSKINSSLSSCYNFLINAKFVFITLGTSIAYKSKQTGLVVANCHKIPSSFYEKIEITVQDGVFALMDLIEKTKLINKNAEIVFTVSPVRHIKDGVVQNNRSKARLHQMIDELQKSKPEIKYFPSYEWMLDDLRDYRFYNADMIHPNEVALDYIWSKFSDHYFDIESKELNKTIEKIMQAVNHKAFQPDSPSHQSFCKSNLNIISDILKNHPKMNFEKEIHEFSKFL